jgi:hypothetical protein
VSPAPGKYGGGGRIFNSPAFYDVSPLDANGERTLVPHVNGVFRDFVLRSAQVGANDLQLVFAKGGRLLEVEQPQRDAAGRPVVLDARDQLVSVSRVVKEPQGKALFFDTANHLIEGAKPLIRAQNRRENVVQRFDAELKVSDSSKTITGITTVPILLDLGGSIVEVEQGQAGGDGVLQAQNQSLVYYTTVVNDVYAYFMTGVKNGTISATRFPTTQTQLDAITTLASTKGVTFPDPEALAIEAKLSWVEAAGLSNLDSYITTTASIPTYDTSDAHHWTPGPHKTAKLAMVGIHVVGSTKGHPEMIWATFEHQNNMPNGAYRYVNSNGGTTLVPQTTAGDWLFSSNGSAGPFNEQRMTFNAPNIDAEQGFTISPSDTLRENSWGAAFNLQPNPLVASAAASNSEILSINNTVRSLLASGDIRANYVMTGATWTAGGAAPTGQFPNGNEVGTSRLANGTMETYQQGTNCFTCHVTNNTTVSHVFPPLKALF